MSLICASLKTLQNNLKTINNLIKSKLTYGHFKQFKKQIEAKIELLFTQSKQRNKNKIIKLILQQNKKKE